MDKKYLILLVGICVVAGIVVVGVYAGEQEEQYNCVDYFDDCSYEYNIIYPIDTCYYKNNETPMYACNGDLSRYNKTHYIATEGCCGRFLEKVIYREEWCVREGKPAVIINKTPIKTITSKKHSPDTYGWDLSDDFDYNCNALLRSD